MDFLPALPPDLAALADPSVRGTAPLLAPADPKNAAALGATPFALCLASLTTLLPSGEALPPAGNDLPTDVVTSDETALDSSLAGMLLALTPAAVAVQSQLRPAELPPATLPADALPVLAPPVDAGPAAMPSLPEPPSLSATAVPAAAQTQPPAELSAAVPLDSGAADAAVTYEHAEPLQPDGAAQLAAEPPSFDRSLNDERRFERLLAPGPEARANAPLPSPQPAAVPQYQAAVAAEAGAVAQSAAKRGELRLVQTAGVSADGGRAALTDWLPAAGSTGSTSQTVNAPVQAAAGPPVDTRSPNWHDAFASRVQWLVDTQVGEAHIKLNPPELGAVDVKISLVDDKTFVQLTTATAAARDELQHSLPRLRELFTVSGLELGGASVQSGRDGQQSASGHGQSGGGAPSDGRRLDPFSTVIPDLLAAAPRPSRSRIDVFA